MDERSLPTWGGGGASVHGEPPAEFAYVLRPWTGSSSSSKTTQPIEDEDEQDDEEETEFMESPHDFDAVHWDHEPVWVVPSVWCSAFRRPGPAKAGTPNRRFMESPPDFGAVHWGHEPVWVVPSVRSPAFRRPRLKPELQTGGSWKAPTTSMPCSGTMNPSGSCHRCGVPPSGGPDRLKPGLQTGGSWKGV